MNSWTCISCLDAKIVFFTHFSRKWVAKQMQGTQKSVFRRTIFRGQSNIILRTHFPRLRHTIPKNLLLRDNLSISQMRPKGKLFMHRAWCRTRAPCAVIGHSCVWPCVLEDIFVLSRTACATTLPHRQSPCTAHALLHRPRFRRTFSRPKISWAKSAVGYMGQDHLLRGRFWRVVSTIKKFFLRIKKFLSE